MALMPPPSSVPSDGLAPNNGVPGQATSAPIPAPDPSVMEVTQSVAQIVMLSRKLADAHPEVTPEVREINNQVQMIQRKLVSMLPPSNVPAPPM